MRVEFFERYDCKRGNMQPDGRKAPLPDDTAAIAGDPMPDAEADRLAPFARIHRDGEIAVAVEYENIIFFQRPGHEPELDIQPEPLRHEEINSRSIYRKFSRGLPSSSS